MILVISTFPNKETAKSIIQGLLENKYIACANIFSNIESMYWWEGKINDDPEVMAIMKSIEDNFELIERYIKEHHPYIVPEILEIKVENSNLDYLNYIISICKLKKE